MKKCHKCGRPWISETKRPGVKEYCEGCSAYLHCCLNCRFYNPSFHNECAIPTTDWVVDKNGANFCDEFEFKNTGLATKDDAGKDGARSSLDKLFGESASQEDTNKPKGFKDLFGE